MTRRTLADVKPELRRLAGQVGMRADDPRVIDLINIAQERLISLGEWPALFARLKFCQYGGLVTLPAEYDSIVSASVEREHRDVFDVWYEFIANGPGHQDSAASAAVAIDRGESPVFRQPGATAMKVRAYSAQDERVSGVRPHITVFGYDEYGTWIRTEVNGVWQDGERLELRGDDETNHSESITKFKKIVKVVKPVTRAEVTLFYVDDSNVLYQCGRYRHWETTPSWRTYLFTGIEDTDTALIHALVRKRFVPARSDSDEMLVSSIPALRLAMIALALEDAGKADEAFSKWQMAEDILNKESKAYRNGRGNPPMDVRMGGEFAVPNLY